MKQIGIILFLFVTVAIVVTDTRANTNTVSSTVLNNAPATANAPTVLNSNSDICKIGIGGSVQNNILGVANESPKWNYNFYEELIKCKMALNLSRGLRLKYTSSNRIAALIGNGIYIFIDEKTKFNDFFNENEVGFYKNFNDLGKKVEFFLNNPKKINEYGKNGKIKYFKLFNNIILTKKIIDKTFS